MRKIVFNVIYIIALIASSVAIIQDKWLPAIFITLLLILIELGQVHQPLKAGNSTKENT